MKNFRKKFIMAAVLTALPVTLLSGCAQKFDAATYVKGSLDAYFKNEITDQYAKLVDGGREAVRKSYDDQIGMMLDEVRELGASDEVAGRYREMFIDLLSKCNYTVGAAAEDKTTGNFTVNVTVEPLKIDMEEIGVKAFAHLEEWSETQDQMEEEAYRAASTEEFFSYMLSLLREELTAPEYLEAQTFEVHVNQGTDAYEIPQDELQKVINATTGLND